MENHTVQIKPITEYTAEELKAFLAQKEQEEKNKVSEEKKKYENDKEAFVKHSAGKFQQLQSELTNLKSYMILNANELYERMYHIEGKDPKETKSFSIKNADDTIKVTVDRQERFSFTDEAIVHINAIKDIFKTKFAPRNKGLYNILDSLLIKGSGGEYDPKLLAKARRQVRELGDENLMNEFDKLDGCQRVTSTASYCRLYIKNEKGKYEDISLQFSSL